MSDRQKVMEKIEEWADRLPYDSLTVEIKMKDETLTIEKRKRRPVGFTYKTDGIVKE